MGTILFAVAEFESLSGLRLWPLLLSSPQPTTRHIEAAERAISIHIGDAVKRCHTWGQLDACVNSGFELRYGLRREDWRGVCACSLRGGGQGELCRAEILLSAGIV